MKVEDAVNYFGSQVKMAEALDLSESAVSKWVAKGGIIPIKNALRIVDLTRGEVSLRLRDY